MLNFEVFLINHTACNRYGLHCIVVTRKAEGFARGGPRGSRLFFSATIEGRKEGRTSVFCGSEGGEYLFISHAALRAASQKGPRSVRN